MLTTLVQIEFGQCPHVDQRVRPIPHAHAQPRHRPFFLRQLDTHGGSNSKRALLRIIVFHANDELPVTTKIIRSLHTVREPAVRAFRKSMPEHFRLLLRNDYPIQRSTGSRHVKLQLNITHLQRAAVIQHAVRRNTVRREIPRVIQLHPKQIT